MKYHWPGPSRPFFVGPAATAGIRAGDQVLRLNGKPVPASRTQRCIDEFLAGNGTTPVKVTLARDGTERMVTVSPVIACTIPIRYVTSEKVNAYTNGDTIIVFSAIVALAKTDDQLAVMIGHELAHTNLGNVRKRKQNALLGTLVSALVDGGFLLGGIYRHGIFSWHLGRAGALAYGVEFEHEADYIGAYHAARAGYDVGGAAQVWRDMGQGHPLRHRPSEMHEVAAEIADKARRHLPLIPDLKPATALSEPAPVGIQLLRGATCSPCRCRARSVRETACKRR